jgi:hypothetical protein
MPDIPGLAEIPAKLLSQCGIVTAVLVIAVVWLATRLAKTTAAWEADRSSMLKMYHDLSASIEKNSVFHAKLEGMLLAFRGRGDQHD